MSWVSVKSVRFVSEQKLTWARAAFLESTCSMNICAV